MVVHERYRYVTAERLSLPDEADCNARMTHQIRMAAPLECSVWFSGAFACWCWERFPRIGHSKGSVNRLLLAYFLGPRFFLHLLSGVYDHKQPEPVQRRQRRWFDG